MLSTALWLWCPLQCFHRCPLSRGGCCSVFRFAKSVSQEHMWNGVRCVLQLFCDSHVFSILLDTISSSTFLSTPPLSRMLVTQLTLSCFVAFSPVFPLSASCQIYFISVSSFPQFLSSTISYLLFFFFLSDSMFSVLGIPFGSFLYFPFLSL